MSLFGFIVVVVLVWWLVFLASLPFGVKRQENVEPGHDPGAPVRPMIVRKAIVTSCVTAVLIGAFWLADAAGIIDIGNLVFGWQV